LAFGVPLDDRVEDEVAKLLVVLAELLVLLEQPFILAQHFVVALGLAAHGGRMSVGWDQAAATLTLAARREQHGRPVGL